MNTNITEKLGIYGWSHFDPVLLASLALRAPLLLVGPHGTGKSLLVERLASALGLTFRHYNASLLNYDDLVGIPILENDDLKFVGTPGAIWGSEFAFFDELSRCRPDLQNKLFPIIHERRVAGIPLPDLQHRWAAMNPPAPDDATDLGNVYIGAENIDPALADRFLFVLPVPDWETLSQGDRQRLLSESQPTLSRSEFTRIINSCNNQISELESTLRPTLKAYVISFVDLLHKAGLPQSPRRARMITDGIIAVHAARIILDGEQGNLETSAEIVARNALPQTASQEPPSNVAVVSSHKQAWEVSNLDSGDHMRAILSESDPVKRILLAEKLEVPDELLSRLITQALSAESSEARCVGLSAIILLKYQNDRDLHPAAWELLAQKARRSLEPRSLSTRLPPGNDLEEWQQINAWAVQLPENSRSHLERNYILGCFPELWRRYSWREALHQFRSDLELFGISGAES